MSVELHLGDCLDVLRTLPDASVDCVVTDPPYPEISRPYGRLTEAEWWALIVEGVIPQVRRVLKPTGSAVFVLQPNSRKVGAMRGWLWEFMAWACREWNMVQDAWWWNVSSVPCGGSLTADLLRPSLKACVWLGPLDCYRDQSRVLWTESEENATRRRADRVTPGALSVHPSGRSVDRYRTRAAAVKRGGTTPFNVIPVRGASESQSRDAGGHSALTSAPLANWWLRYICSPGGTVLDPFVGSGTVAIEALKLGRSAIGIERDPEYHAIARRRIDSVRDEMPLFAVGTK